MTGSLGRSVFIFFRPVGESVGHEGRTADAFSDLSAIQIYLKSAGKNKSVRCEL